MCLVLTALAAIIATFFHYKSGKLVFGTLALIYWGATLMWLVDGFFALSAGEAFCTFSLSETVLGFIVIALGIAAWAILSLAQKRIRKLD